ncbi:MAG: enoyl-CoA hydratase/isomerase family protein [Hydrogenophaga sp.]|jgi:2-(1,2-epoxy-1,2-dihydrophenyl)acetyl-CoA isomerase|nr:enoyl-CoA hydratase/isomerase family protein [Hydrogenophaga sp.]
MTPPILLDIQGAVAHITFNRPEQANVLDEDTGRAFIEVTQRVHQEQQRGAVRAVLLAARGPHFCAGGDIRSFAAAEHIAALLDRSIPPLHAAIHTLSTLPVPVVSAVNGSLGGGGIGIALCADLVLAGASMKLRGGYSAIGLSPDVGVSWALTRLVGPMRAKHILFTNQPLNAAQCLAAGLVAEVHADEALLPAALARVRALAQGAAGSLARIKSLVDQAPGHTLEQQLAMEHLAMVACGASADAREGVHAFLDKRAPRFAGAPEQAT